MNPVNQNMMFYIFLTSQEKNDTNSKKLFVKWNEFSYKDELFKNLISPDKVQDIYWLNMEKISDYFNTEIEKIYRSFRNTTDSQFYDKQLLASDYNTKKKLYYMSAFSASKEKYFKSSNNERFVSIAIESWQEFWKILTSYFQLSITDINKTIVILTKLHDQKLYPNWPSYLSLDKMPSKYAFELIEKGINPPKSISIKDIYDSLILGEKLHTLFPNISPAYLLNIQLPIIDNKKAQHYLEEGTYALKSIEAAKLWYSYIEYKENKFENIFSFYKMMINEFSTQN